MPFLRLPRLTLSRMRACTLLTVFFAVATTLVFTTFYIALPMRRAHYLELDYQRKLLSSDYAKALGLSYVQPLVERAEQLFFWTIPGSQFKTWDQTLGFNSDGTATENGLEFEAWIYLASAAPDSRQQPNTYTHKWKKSDCTDPAYICDMYLDAFRNISKRWRDPRDYGTRFTSTPQALLRWVDCDVSPMLCSPTFGLSGANVLVHMKTGTECLWEMLPYGSCPVTWRWIGLPVHQAPWTRKIRIPLENGGSTVVPAFPSAEEQMWSIMTSEGMVDGMSFNDGESYPPSWNSMVTVTPQDNGPPEADSWPYPFMLWGMFRSMVDNPWELPEWPYETEVKCYTERYTDILLGWWDDAAHLVQPRSCVGVAEEKRKKRREEEEKRKAQEQDWDEFEARQHDKRKLEWGRLFDEVLADIKKFEAKNRTSGVENEQ